MADLLIVLACIAPLGVYLICTRGKGEEKGRFGSIGLGLAFCYFALAHFVVTNELVEMLPSFIPERKLVIYATGVAEAVVAFGLLTRRWRDAASIAAAVLLVTFLPANIYAATNYIGVGDHKLGPDYLWIRIPLQLFLLVWALWPVFWPERVRTR
ncbi:MAG TPA: hypothetical protein VF460_02530 [Burkholderiales bacterium]